MFSFYSTWAVHDALITLISVGPFVPFSEIIMAMYMFYYIHLLQNFFSLPSCYLKIIIYFIYVIVWPAFMSMSFVCIVTSEARRWWWIPRTGVNGDYLLLYWELNMYPLQAQASS